MSDENKKEEQTKDGSFTFKVNKYVLIAMIVGLMIGFVAGREQMKYQIKSAVVDGFAEIFSPSTGGDKKAPEVEKKQETKKKETAPIVVASLLNKGYEKQGYQDYITFSIKFENFGNKNIRAVSGEVEFQNILGEVILPVNISVTEPIAAKSAFQWDGTIDYNQFISSHKAFVGEKQENIKTVFNVRKILYEDGTEETL